MSTPKDAARTAQRSDSFRRIARAGFVVVGVVHIIIGAIAVSIASGGGGDADQDGAMEQIRSTPVGGLLLGVIDNFTAAYISTQYRLVVPLFFLIVIILFRPQGLLGRPEERTV